MKNQTIVKIVFLSLILSSCGLIGDSSTADQSTDSTKEASLAEASTDDLFTQAMEDTNTPSTAHSDAPSNVDTSADLKSLEAEFSPAPAASNDKIIKESAGRLSEEDAPLFVQDTLPEIQPEAPATKSAELTSDVKTYRVQKGETLMQIAFKLYGDIGKWKDLKNMNNTQLRANSSLKANTELKYHAPETPFVWNPSGTPYMIKTGETLGTISNNVYSTPKKWKSIWENNKPLIKNPNVIYAGFTLYYQANMANYVQPAPIAKKVTKAPAPAVLPIQQTEKEIEVMLAEEEAKANKMAERELAQVENPSLEEEAQDDFVDSREEEIRAAQAKAAHAKVEAAKAKILTDEARVENSATEREIDLINNVTVPQDWAPGAGNSAGSEVNEFAPDIDDEVQTLN